MMGWAAGAFGDGGAVLVTVCLVGMGLLVWLLLRLTQASSTRAQPHRGALPEQGAEQSPAGDVGARVGQAIDRQGPRGSSGSGSVLA